jgi:DNA polymerase-3 subunit epsilon
MKATLDGCGCFPTGRHYAGIAHLLRAVVRGLVEEIAADTAWHDVKIALVDVETTGRDASVDRIVELGIAVGRQGGVIERFNWLVNPGIPIPVEASNVHHITDDDVKDAPTFGAIAHEIAAALSGCVPAAYNAAFDRAFLVNEFSRAGFLAQQSSPGLAPPALRREVEWIDPLVWAREIQANEKSRALGDVAARLGVKLENAHRASDDAEAAMLVLYSLAQGGRIPPTYGGLMQEQRRVALKQEDERRRWRQFQS